MKTGIMQPYIFPYIGYFQLIDAVDIFVFYDDVNFMKRGWINRNRLLVNGKENLFSIALSKASQNKLINEIKLSENSKSFNQLLNTLNHNYKKAPYFEIVYSLIEKVIGNKTNNTISSLAIDSIKTISDYLSLNVDFKISSMHFSETKGMDKADRLIKITHLNNSSDYINAEGGIEIYDKVYFKSKGVNLHFIKNEIIPYTQFKNKPVLGLSIIDVLMFNSKEETLNLIKKYKLI